MQLRIITGRSGVGKTRFIQKEIVEETKNQPIGQPIYLIVPAHMTFSVEHHLTVEQQLGSLLRTQVVTFKRLAWQILQEVGGITRKEIDQFGYRMLVKSVLEENQTSFSLFQQAASKRGFTEQIGELLKEFSRYCVTVDSVKEMREGLIQQAAPRTLIDKTNDLSLLVTKIAEKLGSTYVDPEGYLALLTEKIPFSKQLAQSHIYIDGFKNFTAREFALIEQIMQIAERVTIVLPADEIQEGLAPHDLFYTPVQTVLRLQQLAEAVNCPVDLHTLTEQHRFIQPDLAHLEQAFTTYPAQPTDARGGLTIVEAETIRTEVEAVARKIRSVVQTGKSYNQVAIAYRNSAVYDELIETVFAQHDIPVFISRKRPMLHHPLIEFSRSMLDVLRTNWSFEAIFRAVKTDLFIPLQADVKEWREHFDQLENFVLERGIQYRSRWVDENFWQVKRYRGLEQVHRVQTDRELEQQKELAFVRDAVREPLQAFEQAMKQAKTGKEVARALVEFIETLRIYDKMMAMYQQEEAQHHLSAANEHEQAWNNWIAIIDQFVLMFGEEKLTIEEASRILDEGFDTLTFTQIPPALDQVAVMTYEQIDAVDVDCLFVLGLNEGVLPKRIDHEGLLSDADREWISSVGFELAPSSRGQLMDELFVAYRLFSSAKEQLVVSYAQADEEGKAMLASLYIKRLQQLVPQAPIEKVVASPFQLPEKQQTEEVLIPYLSHPRPSLAWAARIKRKQQQEVVAPTWRAFVRYYEEQEAWQMIFNRVCKPMHHSTGGERLVPEVTKQLYGTQIKTSVSRIETYYRCPFQHFASFGLQLKERTVFSLEAPDMGDLFHAALKYVAEEVVRLGLEWHHLTKEQCWQLAHKAMDALTPLFFNQILLSSSRYYYIKKKITEIVFRTIYAVRSQAFHSSFKTIAVEEGFGFGGRLPGLILPLAQGQEMELRGRIDRIDATTLNGQHYLRIVDYKSSSQTLDLTKIVYGLSLQMMTYLDVVLTNSQFLVNEQAMPAGLLYFHVHNPMIRAEKPLNEKQLDDEMVKSFKMNGYILENPLLAKQMDEGMGKTSAIIPATVKNDGDFTKASKVLPTEDIEVVRQYVRSRHQAAGNAMLKGDTRVYPYQLEDQMPCTYCSYRAICQFDPTDPQAEYRAYEALKPEQSLEKMREEVDR